MFTVVITEKEGSERRLTFTEPEVTIGRVPGNDVVLPKGNVSKRHSRIVLKDNRFIVVDLKSTNGTYVNGRKITSPLVVKEGDKIYVGDFVLTLEGDPDASQVPSMKQPSLMPEAMADGLNNVPSIVPSGPPPLPSRAPDPMADDLPAVLRAPTMSSLPAVTSENARASTEEHNGAPITSERASSEQNVVAYATSAPASDNGRSVPPVLAVQSSIPSPPSSSMPPVASVRPLHAGSRAEPERPVERAQRDAERPQRDARRETGAGPLDALLQDSSVFHVLVERFDRVYVDRGTGLTPHTPAFASPEALLATIRKLCAEAGVDASAQHSFDMTLPSGLHVVCVLPAAATDGPLLSLRRRPARSLSLENLSNEGLLDAAHERALSNAIAHRRAIWVVGPPGSDLSSVVAALIGSLPAQERVALFERAPELALGTRSAVCFKISEDGLPTLLERARHFRPDRLVMHELREGDLKPALLAFAQRHDGSIGSVEQRSAKEALVAFDRTIGADTVLRAAGVLVEVARNDAGKTRIAAVHQVELGASGDLVLKPA
jgi:pilus assembly protein CpaF